MDRILLVHENKDLRDLLVEELLGEIKTPVQLEAVGSFDQAIAVMAVGSAFRFALWGAGTPDREGAEADNVGHAPFKQHLAQLAAACPAFLVLATVDDDGLRRSIKAYDRGALALVGPDTNWLESAKRLTRVAFGLEAAAGDPRRTRAVLQIMVGNGSQGQWRIERRGRVQGTLEGTLALEPMEVEDLRTRTEDAEAQLNKDWGRSLPPLGRDVYRLIFRNNTALQSAFQDMLAEAGGPDNVRVVFGLGTEHYGLPVETLKRWEPATNAEQWYSLQAAFLRHYEGAGPLEPLFWDVASRQAAVDCLLVAADPREGPGLEGLPQVEYEVDDIAEALREQKRAGANIGVVQVLKLAGLGNPEAELGMLLAQRQWKLVHFAGHARIRPADGERGPAGELVLNPADETVLDFAAFTRGLPKVQFLFVSSCRSASPAFLQEAIRQSVPAVLGYRWPVFDEDGRDLAAAFYLALFTPGGAAYRSLGRALSQARKQVFAKHLAHFTWASPVLVAKGSAQACGDVFAAKAQHAASTGAAP